LLDGGEAVHEVLSEVYQPDLLMGIWTVFLVGRGVTVTIAVPNSRGDSFRILREIAPDEKSRTPILIQWNQSPRSPSVHGAVIALQ
jgi:hypothetical protein